MKIILMVVVGFALFFLYSMAVETKRMYEQGDDELGCQKYTTSYYQCRTSKLLEKQIEEGKKLTPNDTQHL